MSTIRNQLSTLKNLAAQLAGSNGVLATQEVTAAFKAGTITKAQKDVLSRALADGTPEVKNVQQRLDSFGDVFEKGDVNGNGKSDKFERDAANKAYEQYIWKASVSGGNKAEIDALRAQTLQMTTVMNNGKSHTYPVYGAGTLLAKLEKLRAEAPSASGV